MTRNQIKRLLTFVCSLSFLCSFSTVHSGDRLLATGGITQIEGAAGGGLVPWALIAGYGTDKQLGAAINLTRAQTKDDYEINAGGFAVGVMNRVEISLNQLNFDLDPTVPGEKIKVDTIGIKLKLVGDAIYDQDRILPQISAGVLIKHNEDFDLVPKSLAAENATGINLYLAASKLYLGGFFGKNLLLNGTVMATKENQFGILGFGGDKRNQYSLKPAVSAAVMLTDKLLVGAEYRTKPNNLSVFEEENVHDVFVTWFPVKNMSLTGAYIDLGNIADNQDQTGWYVSGHFAY